jgi:hypothetical protein
MSASMSRTGRALRRTLTELFMTFAGLSLRFRHPEARRKPAAERADRERRCSSGPAPGDVRKDWSNP